MKIGFIGLGGMGAAMVPNLVRAGHQVSVWNRSRAAADELVAATPGLRIAGTIEEAFQNDAVITMLADDAALRSVVLDSGVLATAQAGCIHVSASTISPVLVDELVAAHRAAGVGYIAAPVFGVPAAAAQAKLNVVVAGAAAEIARVQGIFDAIAQKTWPMGDDPKRANIVKIAGNMMITLAIEAMGEASALVGHYGVSAADFLDVITNTLMASPSYQRYGGFIATNTYEPGFRLALGLKDVNLALDAARAKQSELPALNVVHANMTDAMAGGYAAKDWSILAKVARRRAGISEAEA